MLPRTAPESGPALGCDEVDRTLSWLRWRSRGGVARQGSAPHPRTPPVKYRIYKVILVASCVTFTVGVTTLLSARMLGMIP